MTPGVSAEQGNAEKEPVTPFNAKTFAFEKKRPKAKSKKAASKVKRSKASKTKATGSHENYAFGKRITADEEFTAEMARYLRDDPKLSWSGVLKLMRRDGIGGGTRRAERLLPAAQKLAKESNGKGRPASKKKAAKSA